MICRAFDRGGGGTYNRRLHRGIAMRVLAPLLLLGSLAGCAAAPGARDSSLPLAASAGQCSCAGATTSYRQVECSAASGGAMYRPQRCYVKRVAGTGEICGTACDAAENVCAGQPPAPCR